MTFYFSLTEEARLKGFSFWFKEGVHRNTHRGARAWSSRASLSTWPFAKKWILHKDSHQKSHFFIDFDWKQMVFHVFLKNPRKNKGFFMICPTNTLYCNAFFENDSFRNGFSYFLHFVIDSTHCFGSLIRFIHSIHWFDSSHALFPQCPPPHPGP